MEAEPEHPELQPQDERTALVQRLDQYRAIATAALVDRTWIAGSTTPNVWSCSKVDLPA